MEFKSEILSIVESYNDGLYTYFEAISAIITTIAGTEGLIFEDWVSIPHDFRLSIKNFIFGLNLDAKNKFYTLGMYHYDSNTLLTEYTKIRNWLNSIGESSD